MNNISSKDAFKIIAKNTPSIIISVITSLSSVDPSFVILFALASGMINSWGEFGQARVNELITDLNNNKEKFDLSVTSSDKFKSIFLNILERHMKESSEEKRRLFRNYLNEVASGKNIEFNNHTKLLLILDQITPEELRLFMVLPSVIVDWQQEGIRLGGDINDEIYLNRKQIQLRLLNWSISEKEIGNLLGFLNNYGLVNIQNSSGGTIGGGGNSDVDFRGLTDCGRVFYDYINDESPDKTIVNLV